MGKCIVCGVDESEVPKLHYFPRNREKSQLWQEHLGINIQHDSLRNYRICSKHFSNSAYENLSALLLHKDALPLKFTVEHDKVDVQPETTGISETIVFSNAKEADKVVIPPASTSAFSKRSRIYRNIPDLEISTFSTRKKQLINIIRRKEDQLRKVKKLCKRRGNDLKKLSNLTDSNVVRNLFNNMPSVTAKFMMSQIKSYSAKSARGRRWDFEEKVLALTIFKRSPKCYRLLRSFVALPSKKTLLSMLRKVPFQTGINSHIFQVVNENVLNGMDRWCVLLFDEMDIQLNIQYDAASDGILGFEDMGFLTSNRPANKALVFMLVGITRNWKQPVAYYFNSNGCKADMLRKCIFDVLDAAKNIANVNVVATICDMGVNNVKCMKDLGVTVDTPFFIHNGQQIYAMYDPPHLLKCTYSLFRKHNILIESPIGEFNTKSMEARFEDIVTAVNIDKQTPYVFRTLHKIKEYHIRPVMQYTMKVCVAAQTLSHTVAAYLYSLTSRGDMESRTVATAAFVKEVDTLFDSFNGRTIFAPDGKELRCAIKPDSPHIQYWTEMFKKVKNWQYVRLTKNGTMKKTKPPSQMGWLTSMNAIKRIWSFVESNGGDHMYPRKLNQDPLENLFGLVRYGCGCNENPTTKQFVSSLKTQIINGLANQSRSAMNCEADDGILLSNLKSFLLLNHQQDQTEQDRVRQDSAIDESANIFDKHNQLESLANTIASDVQSGNRSSFSVAYVAGFIIKRVLPFINNCELCYSELISNDTEAHNLFISYKEWTDSVNKLIYPSTNVTVFVGSAVTMLELYLAGVTSKANITKNAYDHLYKNMYIDCLTCIEHKRVIVQLILTSVLKIGIPWFCKRKTQEIINNRKNKTYDKKMRKLKHK